MDATMFDKKKWKCGNLTDIKIEFDPEIQDMEIDNNELQFDIYDFWNFCGFLELNLKEYGIQLDEIQERFNTWLTMQLMYEVTDRQKNGTL